MAAHMDWNFRLLQSLKSLKHPPLTDYISATCSCTVSYYPFPRHLGSRSNRPIRSSRPHHQYLCHPSCSFLRRSGCHPDFRSRSFRPKRGSTVRPGLRCRGIWAVERCLQCCFRRILRICSARCSPDPRKHHRRLNCPIRGRGKRGTNKSIRSHQRPAMPIQSLKGRDC